MTAPKLGSRLLGLADEGKRVVVVDLSEVTFMDSTGIGVLLNALRHFATRHQQAGARLPDSARAAAVRGHGPGRPAHHLRSRERRSAGSPDSAAGARVLVAELLEALRRAVRGRRGVVLGRVRRARCRDGGGRCRRASRCADRPSSSAWSVGLRGRAGPSVSGASARAAGGGVGRRLVVAAAAGGRDGQRAAAPARRGAASQRSTAGSRRPQCGQSFRSFWTSCSSEHPHRRRFSTA